MNKFISLTYLVFLTYIILSLLLVSEALPTDDVSSINAFEKRNRNCNCAIATADFNNDDSSLIGGLVMYSQDEVGDTTITGSFSRGFQDKNITSYGFLIQDHCGNTIHDLSSQWRDNLELSPTRDSTRSFSFKNNNFNLNCDSNGILLIHTEILNKRNTCKRLNKRAYGSTMVVQHNGAGAATANIG